MNIESPKEETRKMKRIDPQNDDSNQPSNKSAKGPFKFIFNQNNDGDETEYKCGISHDSNH